MAAAAAIRSTTRRNSSSAFGKILRIDPLGTNSANGKYGIPGDNPFVSDNNPATLGEIYAYGVRNPQRFSWDPKNGNLFVADIGQNIVEEVSQVTPGRTSGGTRGKAATASSAGRRSALTNPRGDSKVTYPIVEYDQLDPLLQPQSAVTMGVVYRRNGDPAAREPADLRRQPERRGVLRQRRQAAERRPGSRSAGSCSTTKGRHKTLLQLIQEKNAAQGKPPAHARRPALRRRAQRPDLHPEQARRRHSPADKIGVRPSYEQARRSHVDPLAAQFSGLPSAALLCPARAGTAATAALVRRRRAGSGCACSSPRAATPRRCRCTRCSRIALQRR